jgi:hypothetical protein
MSVIGEESVFTSLLQQGPLAVGESVNLHHPFSHTTRRWVKNLQCLPLNSTKYRALRSQIFEFLDISSFSQIRKLLQQPERQHERSRRACALLGNMFGLHGTQREIEARVYEYARTADAVVNSLKSTILSPYSSYVATTNEIEVANDPVTLLLIMFNDRYHKKARFEARRKLTLMNLAGSIDQRERETLIEEKFSHFLHFLNDYVWSKELKIGEHDIVYLHSSHAQEDFRCTAVNILKPQEAKGITPQPGEKLTLLKRRRFTAGSRVVPIYVSIRKKPPEAKVLKLLRKNQKNPAVAVDDELGLMAVLDSVADIKTFQQHLTRSAARADSLMVLEDISDTLSGPSLSQATASGSSPATEMMKFFARLGGMRVEFIIHTNRTWLNYMYKKEVSHDEYEVRRIFDSGVMELLFPREIFGLEHETIRTDMIRRFRRRIEE